MAHAESGPRDGAAAASHGARHGRAPQHNTAGHRPQQLPADLQVALHVQQAEAGHSHEQLDALGCGLQRAACRWDGSGRAAGRGWAGRGHEAAARARSGAAAWHACDASWRHMSRSRQVAGMQKGVQWRTQLLDGVNKARMERRRPAQPLLAAYKGGTAAGSADWAGCTKPTCLAANSQAGAMGAGMRFSRGMHACTQQGCTLQDRAWPALGAYPVRLPPAARLLRLAAGHLASWADSLGTPALAAASLLPRGSSPPRRARRLHSRRPSAQTLAAAAARPAATSRLRHQGSTRQTGRAGWQGCMLRRSCASAAEGDRRGGDGRRVVGERRRGCGHACPPRSLDLRLQAAAGASPAAMRPGEARRQQPTCWPRSLPVFRLLVGCGSQ